MSEEGRRETNAEQGRAACAETPLRSNRNPFSPDRDEDVAQVCAFVLVALVFVFLLMAVVLCLVLAVRVGDRSDLCTFFSRARVCIHCILCIHVYGCHVCSNVMVHDAGEEVRRISFCVNAAKLCTHHGCSPFLTRERLLRPVTCLSAVLPCTETQEYRYLWSANPHTWV